MRGVPQGVYLPAAHGGLLLAEVPEAGDQTGEETEEREMTKELTLTTGEKALVDDGDYGWASMHDWRLHHDGHVVRSGVASGGEPEVVYLCNEVMSRAKGIPLVSFGPPRS